MPGPSCCLIDVLVSAGIVTTLTSTSMFSLHSNAQRPSAITGMRREELELGLKRRKLGDTERAVIVVRDHKTGQSMNY